MGFEDYIQQKKDVFVPKMEEDQHEQKQEGEIAFQREYDYERQQQKGFGDQGEDQFTVGYVNEQIQERMEQTTFEERTEYYFKDSEYMASKVARYNSIADGNDPSLDEYAKKHTNRSAKKRKQKAEKAATYFDKARRLENKLNNESEAAGEGGIPPLDLYKRRNEIMRARLDGMINAAKVKSSSDRDEAFRIAKAKISCLSILMDQTKNLMTEETSKSFMKIQNGLAKELAAVQESLKKNQPPSVMKKWQEAMGIDEAAIKKTKEEYKDCGITDDTAMLHLLMSKEVHSDKRPEADEVAKTAEKVFGQPLTQRRDEITVQTYYVKRDKNGKPINKEELRKDEWNKKWYRACMNISETGEERDMSAERDRMTMEAYERIRKYELPKPEELKKKNGAINFVLKDPATYQMMVSMCLRLDNIRGYNTIIFEKYRNDKELKAKIEAVSELSQIVNNEMTEVHNFDPNFYKMKGEDHYFDEEEFENNQAEYLMDYETRYNAIAEKEKIREEAEKKAKKRTTLKSYAEMKEELNNDPAFDEKAYEKYKQAATADLTLSCPQYVSSFDSLRKIWKSTEDLTRVAGSVLRRVNFNSKWEPVSDEDLKNHEWNMKFLNNLEISNLGPELTPRDKRVYEEEIVNNNKIREEEGKPPLTEEEIEQLGEHKRFNMAKEESKKIVEEMVKEEYTKVFEKEAVELPDPEMLRKEFLEPFMNGQPMNCAYLEKLYENLGDTIRIAQKAVSMQGTYSHGMIEKDFITKKMDAYAAAFSQMNGVFSMYMGAKYRVDQTKAAGGNSSPLDSNMAAMVEMQIGEYEKELNKYKESSAG